MARLENPPTTEVASPLVDAVTLARENPGEWVFAKGYANQNTSVVAGWKLRKRFVDIETTTRRERLYVRVAG